MGLSPFFLTFFRIDSLRALADAQANMQPRGEFADLLDLLTRQMAGAAGNRIRRANFPRSGRQHARFVRRSH